MRLKAFHAATAEEAIRLVQRELGDDALVVSTETDAGGVRVMVAVAEPDEAPEPSFAPYAVGDEDEPADAEPAPRFGRGAPPPESDALARVLAFHGVPSMLAARLRDGAKLGRAASDAALGAALADRLSALFRFAPLGATLGDNGAVLVVGPPGSGKTMAVAKLAAQAVLDGRRVRLATCDRNSAGGFPALAAFARILGVSLDIAETPEELQRLAFAARDTAPLIVDTAAVNPGSAAELAALARLVVATGGEPVLALQAGLDVGESADTAEAFARIGCTRFIATKLDVARRMGGLLAAAADGTCAFAEICVSAGPADGFETVDAGRLARILVAAATGARAARHPEAVS